MTIEWFDVQTSNRNIFAINFGKSTVSLSKLLVEKLREQDTTHIQIGCNEGKVIIKPATSGLKILKNHKTGTVSLTKTLAGWLEKKNIAGKYELVYNEEHDWWESK